MHKYFFAGGVFDFITMLVGSRILIKGPHGCVIYSSSCDSESRLAEF